MTGGRQGGGRQGGGRQGGVPAAARPKTTVAELGIDPAGLDWQRSGDGDGGIEIAFVAAGGGAPVGRGASSGPGASRSGTWVLMRVAGDPAGRILVYDEHEWACFLDGVRNGEFDEAAGPAQS